MLPSLFLSLEREERAFIIACINKKIDDERQAEKEAKAKARRGKR